MKTIVITGASGSGKTYLSQKIKRDLNNTIVVRTDSYYKDNLIIKLLSFFMNDIYDRIISINETDIKKTIDSIYSNKKEIIFYKYDFKRKKSTKSLREKEFKTKFLIVEGIFSHRIGINYKNSINIICKTDKEICYQRRLKRDELERGRNRKEITTRFNKSWNLFFKHLTRYKKNNLVHELNPVHEISYKKIINKII